jgi:hypothetical protein
MPIVGNLLNSLPCFAFAPGTCDLGHTDVAGPVIAKPLAHRAVSSAHRHEEIIPNPRLDLDLARPPQPARAPVVLRQNQLA